MKLTLGQKAAAWAVVQALFAGCSAGGGTDSNGSPSPSPTPAPAPAPAPAPTPGPAPSPTPTQAPTITTQPASTSVAPGATATFTVVIDNPTGAVYQWYDNGTTIAGAVAASYTTPATTQADSGEQFTVKAFTTAGSVTSQAATLTVVAPSPTPSPAPSPSPAPAPTGPTISAQPVSAAVITGSTNTFAVTASGSGTLTYQWRKNGTAISGATNSQYTTPAVAYTDQGTQYTVVVTDGTGASSTSNAATLTLALSSNQSLYESFALAPAAGIYELDWDLNYVGAQSPATSFYLTYDYATATVSPLTNGPQTIREQPYTKIATTLAADPSSPTRVLKNGVVLVVPGSQNLVKVTYVGANIQVDDLADDNTTIAYSEIRSAYQVGGLSGLLHSAPSQITQPYNSIFGNPNVLDTTTSWASGSQYMVFTVNNVGDRYNVFDCQIGVVTTDANVSPCATGTTLAAAMAAGQTSVSDGVTYTTSSGTISTVGGIPVWIATAPRRQQTGVGLTTQYRIYFQLNGNVYTGALIHDGQLMATHHYRTTPSDSTTTVYLNYDMRLNQPAVQSLVAGSLL